MRGRVLGTSVVLGAVLVGMGWISGRPPVRVYAEARLEPEWNHGIASRLENGSANQRGSADLSDAEVEEVRDAAADPARRVTVFQSIVDTRIERIQKLLVNSRMQGRMEDFHQNMDEISGVINELQDNIAEYAAKHRDLRKVLPKLLGATERWQSVLRQPPDHERYKVTRQIALEAVADLRAQAEKLVEEQAAYFKEHPPKRDTEGSQYQYEVRR